jgi:hypothetical protein
MRGYELVARPTMNKDAAFTRDERALAARTGSSGHVAAFFEADEQVAHWVVVASGDEPSGFTNRRYSGHRASLSPFSPAVSSDTRGSPTELPESDVLVSAALAGRAAPRPDRCRRELRTARPTEVRIKIK